MSLRHLSMSQLAEVTGMDRRTVKDRLKDVEPFGTHGKAILFDAAQVLPILLGYAKAGDLDVAGEMAAETLRLEKARADKEELLVEKLRSEVVPIDDVERVVAKEYAYVRAAILTLPSKRAKALALEDDPAKIQSILKDDINEVLAHLQADKELVLTDEAEDESYFPDDEPVKT